MDDDILYLKKEKLLLNRASTGFYEPIGYNVDAVEGCFEGEEIIKNSFFHDFIMYIRFSERKKITSGKNRNKFRDGFAEIYQWVYAFKALGITKNMNAEQLIGVFSRQSGKSWISRKLLAFLLIFYTHHFDLGIHDRFYVIFANLKRELVEGQLLKLLPEIRKAIECYSMLYPDMYIEWSETPKEFRIGKKLLNNTSIIHFNRVVNGESESYSQMDIISLNSKVISAGLSAHLMYIDELQNISYEWVSQQALPFLASCAGVLLGTGTANNSVDSALYRYYKSEIIPNKYKYILNWEEVYKLKKHISKQHADTYKITVDREIAEKGINSIVIQSEWYCNFNISTDRFLTLEDMRNNNMMTEDINTNISFYTDKNTYRLASLDPAISGDRCAFGTAITGYDNFFTWTKATNFEVIKEADEQIDPDDLIKRVVELCKANTIDYLIVDNTAGQKYLTSPLYKELMKETKTQIIPFDYSGSKEKVKMCRYNEGLIMKQSFKILKEEYKLKNEGFKYLLEELPTLEKQVTSQGYNYKAEKSLKDDFAMCYFMMGYALEYLKECIENKKEFKIGKYIHRLYLRKWTDIEKKQVKKQKYYMIV